ncbi:hypothetical protein BDU57DRAFT_537351 [Ampelomyces quisqualis]|uniref:FHA domain-containing protein n=1 Tax=Ampelomyces quisqualis TaxID=50730 RepID=A0A6A5QQR8_AMPQU|nr:hypothetical protein BDU57DRAFT_537351 [Ampelomyces quisqualis]
MSDTFRVVLRDVDGFEGIDSREFELPLGSNFPIGRASRNTTKKALMPAANNAFIDSPVISREHAILTVNADNGALHVCISDQGSMHGTMVNGERLAPRTPKQLASGDNLQFGIDINRNEEFFVARKYQFEAERIRPQTSFSQGFTAPYSDEEEVGGTTSRHGSQCIPLTLDESDSESDVSAADHADLTMMGDDFIVDDEEDEPPAVAEIYLHRGPYSEPTDDELLMVDNFSDNEGSGGYYSSDVQDDELDDELEDELLGDSEASFDSARPEPLAKQAEAASEAFEKQQKIDLESALPIGLNQHMASNDLVPEPRNVFDETDAQVPSLDSQLDDIKESFRIGFGNAFPPPLPPRPQAAQPNHVGIPSNRPPWYSDNSQGYGTNHGDRPILFSPAPPPAPFMPSVPEPDTSGWNFGPSTFPPFANRMQTPPTIFQASNAMPTTPPPNRRTKVSIGEIVEEQPLTPTSDNDMKRKADVLDEPDMVETTPELAEDSRAEPAVVLKPVEEKSAQTAAAIAQRPKKEPRSILARVRTTAKYLGVGAAGAAGAVALLSSLPDAFFA